MKLKGEQILTPNTIWPGLLHQPIQSGGLYVSQLSETLHIW